MPKLMYKDGITRTVSDFDIEKFKELGFEEVIPEPQKEKKQEAPQKSKSKNVD